jgi:hypothetical protein
MDERHTSAKRVKPIPTEHKSPDPMSPAPDRDDPYGRQVFFSQTPNVAADRGSGRIRAQCSACGTESRMTLPDVLRAHFPLWAWVPVRHSAHWIRCPSCARRTWVRLTPVLHAD